MQTTPVLALSSLLALTPAIADNAGYRITGPYQHDNLTVFLVHPAPANPAKPPGKYLALQEALEQKKAVVHETGNVNELKIENLSQDPLYIQAGDIVKGGQQDRVLSNDLLVPPRSGPTPVAAFCVEQGRWSRRGSENVKQFSAAATALGSKEAKLAASKTGNQAGVWASVSKAMSDLNAGLMAKTKKPAAVAAASSPTSYMLAMENKDLTATVDEYSKALLSLASANPTATGFAFAINNDFAGADLYSSAALFRTMWPKLLRAGATEAVGRYSQPKKPAAVTASDVKQWLVEPAAAARKVEARNTRTTTVTVDSPKALFQESRDKADGDAWVHRSFVAK
jgi:hypothetical protein